MPELSPTEKLAQLVETLDEQPMYWTDNVPFWRATSTLIITAGDVREWLRLINGS